MTIIYNNEPIKLPHAQMSVEDLVNWKQLAKQGTAIAVNDKLVKKDLWSVTFLKDLDNVTIITAAFGG